MILHANGIDVAIKGVYEDHQYMNGYIRPALHIIMDQVATAEQAAALTCGNVVVTDDDGIEKSRHEGYIEISEYNITIVKESEAEKEIAELQEIRTQTNVLLNTAIDSGAITHEQGIAIVQVWKDNTKYVIGDIRAYNVKLYRCVQAHTSQPDWMPTATPALWASMGVIADDPTAIPEWVQPTGAHDAYLQGDKVLHNSKTWTSTINANVWEPGVYGWEVTT